MDAKVGAIVELLSELRVKAVRQEVELAASRAEYRDLLKELEATRKKRLAAEERLEKHELDQLKQELDKLRNDLDGERRRRLRPRRLNFPSEWPTPVPPVNTPKTPETPERNPWTTSHDTHSGLEKLPAKGERPPSRGSIECDCGLCGRSAEEIEKLELATESD